MTVTKKTERQVLKKPASNSSHSLVLSQDADMSDDSVLFHLQQKLCKEKQLLHELQVHKIELEMQNEALQEAHAAAEEAKWRYAELFDLAPMAYFILMKDGAIQQANFRGAKLLGQAQSHINGLYFSKFVSTESRPIFKRFLDEVYSSDQIKGCELSILQANTLSYISLQAIAHKSKQTCLLAVSDITDHKLNEEKLRESNAFNLCILNSMDSHIAVLNNQGVIIAVNEAWIKFAQTNGLTEFDNHILGVNYFDVFKNIPSHMHSFDITAAHTGLLEVLTGKRKTFSLVYPCHSTNQERWFHMKVTPLTGPPFGIVVSHENITERVIIEKQKKSSERKFRLIIEASPVPMTLNDEQCNIVYVNPAFEQMFGYDLDDIPTVADWYLKAFPEPEYRRWVESSLCTDKVKIIQGHDNEVLELKIRTKNNCIKTVLATCFEIQDDCSGGQVQIFYDMTQRIHADAKLNSVFNAAMEGIVSYNIYKVIVSANAAVETIFGYKPDELIGCNIIKIMPSLLNHQFECNCSAFESKPIGILEIEGLHKNGSVVPLDLSKSAYSIDNECYFTTIVRDVSLRKQREHQHKEHLRELAHVTRLGLMGEMAAGIAHEVNQPLAAISCYTQASVNLLNSEKHDPQILRDILQKTQQQAVRAGQIIHRMREFIKTSPKQRATVDINTLIHDAASLCNDEIKQNNITLTFVLENGLPAITADYIQIEQVLINLIRNSIDALKNQDNNPLMCQISIHSLLTANDCIQVRVKDNGAGIDKDQQLKILMPFYTTKEEGMGMGLSISRSLIEEHGGTLYFNSKPGKGSTFYFTLPQHITTDNSA
jgi:PAS domain S-box-containing protein